jgi:hypothetical protein
MTISKIFEKSLSKEIWLIITTDEAATFFIERNRHRPFAEGRENLAVRADIENMN